MPHVRVTPVPAGHTLEKLTELFKQAGVQGIVDSEINSAYAVSLLFNTIQEAEAACPVIQDMHVDGAAGGMTAVVTTGADKVILVPMQGTTDVIEIPLSMLPDDAEEVMEPLRNELAPLHIWIEIAVAYLTKGMNRQFMDILKEACVPEIAQYYPDSEKERSLLLNMRASALIAEAEDMPAGPEWEMQRKDKIAEAEKCISDSMDLGHSFWAVQGLAHLSTGDVNRQKQAEKMFTEALKVEGGGADPIALVGLGRLRLSGETPKYTEALAHFRRVLSNNPDCSADIRYAIGICLDRLGRHQEAKVAFERVLQIDASHVEAMSALSQLASREGNTKKARKLITTCWSKNRTHTVLLASAREQMARGKYESARTIAEQAEEKTHSRWVKASACVIIAKTYHAVKDFDNAREFYQQAVDHWPDYPPALIGHAQCAIHFQAFEQAFNSLTKVADAFPGHTQVSAALASVCMEMQDHERAQKHLEAILEQRPIEKVDHTVLRSLALIYADKQDFEKAHFFVQHAEQNIMEQSGGKLKNVPAPFMTNRFALQALDKKTDDYFNDFLMSKGSLFEGGRKWDINQRPIPPIKPKYVSFVFNSVKTLAENDKHIDFAIELLEAIVRDAPGYHDAPLLLAQIYAKQGKFASASLWASLVLAMDEGSVPALSVKASLHLDLKQPAEAEKLCLKMMPDGKRQGGAQTLEPYPALVIAHLREHHAKNQTTAPRSLWYAGNLFSRVLKDQPDCVAASEGIGAVLARGQYINQAKSIFKMCYEADNNRYSAWHNLAMIHLAAGEPKQAASIAKSAMRRFGSNKENVVLCAAALWLAKDHDGCQEMIEKWRELEPESFLPRLNGLTVARYVMDKAISATQAYSQRQNADSSAMHIIKPVSDEQLVRVQHLAQWCQTVITECEKIVEIKENSGDHKDGTDASAIKDFENMKKEIQKRIDDVAQIANYWKAIEQQSAKNRDKFLRNLEKKAKKKKQQELIAEENVRLEEVQRRDVIQQETASIAEQLRAAREAQRQQEMEAKQAKASRKGGNQSNQDLMVNNQEGLADDDEVEMEMSEAQIKAMEESGEEEEALDFGSDDDEGDDGQEVATGVEENTGVTAAVGGENDDEDAGKKRPAEADVPDAESANGNQIEEHSPAGAGVTEDNEAAGSPSKKRQRKRVESDDEEE